MPITLKLLPWWIIGKEFMGNAGDKGQEFLGQKDPLEKEVKQPTAIFLPGKFHGERSLVGYSPWSHKELDMTNTLSNYGAGEAS